MFGLENQKKKKIDPFVFELEKELKNPKRYRELKQRVDSRIQRIRTLLKGGENQTEFDQLGALLHGYTSLLKVMARCVEKK